MSLEKIQILRGRRTNRVGVPKTEMRRGGSGQPLFVAIVIIQSDKETEQ